MPNGQCTIKWSLNTPVGVPEKGDVFSSSLLAKAVCVAWAGALSGTCCYICTPAFIWNCTFFVLPIQTVFM